MLQYGKVDGKYCILTPTQTDLDWDGPEDKSLLNKTVLKADDLAKTVIDITLNASGETITKKVTLTSNYGGSRSSWLNAQYIEKIVVR